MFAGVRNADIEKKNKKVMAKKKKKQAKQGKISCACATGAFVLLGVAVLASVLEITKMNALIGGMGASSIVISLMGIKASVKGRREREKSHLTCWIGAILNLLLLVGLIIIYII